MPPVRAPSALIAFLVGPIGGCGYEWSTDDGDGDGYSIAAGDCWDSPEGPKGSGLTGAAIHPGRDDLWYDGVDADCADDDDYDVDRDGYVPTAYLGLPTLGVPRTPEDNLPGGDCWDDPSFRPVQFAVVEGEGELAAADVHPGAADTWYDGADQDCGGEDDFDADADGARSDAHPDTNGDEGDDCDDGDPQVGPDAVESWYDGTDQDCDGNDCDADRDGYESDPDGAAYCASEDCDDQDASAQPGGTEEWYDGVDQDCDGNDADQDLDGFEGMAAGGPDCDDLTPDVNPSVVEVWYDGVDQDCDGNDADADGDGAEARTAGGSDCDDADAAIAPGAVEVWYDGIDQDCLGDDDYDQDGDGHDATAYGDDCDDEDAGVFPGALEDCATSSDDDCDGDTNDRDALACTDFWYDGDGDGYGSDSTEPRCYCVETGPWSALDDLDCDDGDLDANPDGTEVCDSADSDEDCDGLADDSDPSVDVATYSDSWSDADDDGYGDPSAVLPSCDVAAGTASNDDDCDDSRSDVNPLETEVCDGADADEDCDGLADDDDPSVSPSSRATVWQDSDGDGFGNASAATSACDVEAGWAANDDDCDDASAEDNPDASETTGNEDDDDCDGGEVCFHDDDDDGYLDSAGDTVASSDADCDDAFEASSSDPTGDCDDATATRSPVVPEVCDAADIDEDCDGQADDLDPEGATGTVAYFLDVDGDEWGSTTSAGSYCDDGTGRADNSDDCNDACYSCREGSPSHATDGNSGSDLPGYDDNCNAYVDEGVSTTGMVIVNEIMNEPSGSGAEWFELTNVSSSATYYLDGWRFELAGSASDPYFCASVDGDLSIAPGEYLLFCSEDTIESSGGTYIPCDYVWGSNDYQNFGTCPVENATTWVMDDAGDEEIEIVLVPQGYATIDLVAFNASWPSAEGLSMELDPTAQTATDNDSDSKWCAAAATDAFASPAGTSQRGTPGSENTCP